MPLRLEPVFYRMTLSLMALFKNAELELANGPSELAEGGVFSLTVFIIIHKMWASTGNFSFPEKQGTAPVLRHRM